MARGASIPVQPSSDQSSSQTAPESLPTSGGRTLGLRGLLIELVLPMALSSALLLVLAGYTSYWDLHTRVGLLIFGLLLVALSLFLSVRLDALTLTRRRRRGKKQLLNRADARSRLVKFVLGGVAIPIAALVVANVVELPNHKTPMSLAIQLTFSRPQRTREVQLGDAVLRAESSAVRVQGILALQASSSDAALEQLLRILADGPAALTGGEYEALSTALASYAVRAKPGLLRRLSEARPSDRRDATAPPGDMFERYFADGFAQLKSEIDHRDPDPAAQASRRERLQIAQADLKQALSQVEGDARYGQKDRSLPAFVMQTFLAMRLKQDADLLLFARQSAADPAWSDAVRGQALLLVAKLGGKDDLDGLYSYLENPSALLQLRAMQAIAVLQSKLSAAASSG
jgi:hypothetical protein